MRKITFYTLILSLFPLLSWCQWASHYTFPISVMPPRTSALNDVLFTSSDTGFYCYTVNAPSPSTPREIYLKRTTDDCQTWNTVYQDSKMGISSAAIKYFSPHLYYFWNDQGIYRIERKLENSSWQSLANGFGYHLDFFATDSSNYKILYKDYSDRVLQRFFQNNVEVRTDTFATSKPSKMFYPKDTVGVFLSLSFPSTGYNSIILKYTPSTGYAATYNNPDQKLSDVHFPSSKVGYVACDSGIVLRTNDLGSSWTPLNTGHSLKLRSIFFTNDSTGFAAGDSGLILQTTNYGLTWQQQSAPINTPINKVFFVNDSVGFALTGQVLLKTTNGGTVWVSEISHKDQTLSVFPNPIVNDCSIKIPQECINSKNLTLVVYDCFGKSIREYQVANVSDTFNVSFDGVAKGLYTIILQDKEKKYYSKVVVE